MLKVILNSIGKKKYFFKIKYNFLFFNKKNLFTQNKSENNVNSIYRKENEIILHKSYLLKDSKINDIINILNLYIKLKNENIELLKNVSINLLMNKEKLRYGDIIILLKKFSIIKCKNYYLFCYFKDALIDNLHLLKYDELIDVYFSFTNLNYFHYNFYLLIEKKLFHNFNLIDLKKLILLIQCFNKKKIITKNYLTILLYSISKNINKFNIFQLSVIFSFFKNFKINNSILINSLIHNFNQNVNINDSTKCLSLFYNFLSYINKKCKKNYMYFEKEKELIGVIKQFKLKFEKEEMKYEDELHEIEENEEINNEYNKKEMKLDIDKMNYEENSEKKKKIGEYIKKNISLLENNILLKNEQLQKLKEQTHLLKKNSYNFNLMYSIKNTLKNIEIITKKNIKFMSVQSLCLISSALSNIDKNKLILEKIAEEVGKQSTKLTPLLISFLLLSFSKANHKHGSLIYYSLQFFYKYYKFFNINEVGILCKSLQNFSIKENEFINILNEFILSNQDIYNNIHKEKKIQDNMENLNYDNNNNCSNNHNMEKLFYEIEKSIEKNIEFMNYEDQFKNLKRIHKDEDKKHNDNHNKKNNYDKKYNEFVNFSYIDYENIKKNNYYPNNLYNIKMNNSIYINNIIYILEYYSFNLIRIDKILDIFCDIFIKSDLNYILYSRIFYSFYLLQYQNKKIYELIESFNNYQPLYQAMYKEKHMMKILESLIYYYENKNENKMSDIHFYVLSKSSFSFIFNFSKYFLTFLFIKNNNHVFHKFLLSIKDITLIKDYIFLHKPNNLY
ncbi:conserved Plasmodium protein, unknown function [Plasmodium gallinaceum]|uniref:Uncharacterized protein n=1 Tax=Plasmodium gallinaceum TaxID=5849 RepID=A0A1J1GSL9_PLAGA|nr:conserved Plasmodium protein, unknown function [Plasmodium gallinaceum]CRG94043.1 conserved Plasmodium protein, unknown function [Plasmodium gallinaceum]